MLALVEDRLGILHIWLFIVSVKYELVTLLWEIIIEIHWLLS